MNSCTSTEFKEITEDDILDIHDIPHYIIKSFLEGVFGWMI